MTSRTSRRRSAAATSSTARGGSSRTISRHRGSRRVVDRIEGMGEADLLRQSVCIRGSFAAGSPTVRAPAPVRNDPGSEATTSELIREATRIGEQLADLAHLRDGQAHWTGLVPSPDGGFDYTMIGPDLYEGTAGIALFLAYLARATGRRDFDGLARAAYTAAACRLLPADGGVHIGAFTGASGLLYTALHLSHLWDDDAILDDALPVLELVGRRVGKDRHFDVLERFGGLCPGVPATGGTPAGLPGALGRRSLRPSPAPPCRPHRRRVWVGPGRGYRRSTSSRHVARGRRCRRSPGPAGAGHGGPTLRTGRPQGDLLRAGPFRRRHRELAGLPPARLRGARVGVVPRHAGHRNRPNHDPTRRR